MEIQLKYGVGFCLFVCLGFFLQEILSGGADLAGSLGFGLPSEYSTY